MSTVLTTKPDFAVDTSDFDDPTSTSFRNAGTESDDEVKKLYTASFFTVNLKPGDVASATATAMQTDLNNSDFLLSTMVNRQVKKKVTSGELVVGTDAEQNYAAIVRVAYMESAMPWLKRVAKIETTKDHKVTSNGTEFHGSILQQALGGLDVPAQTYASFESMFKGLMDSLRDGSDGINKDKKAMSIVLTFMIYDPVLNLVRPRIRTINFVTTAELYILARGKSESTGSSFTITLTGYEYDFLVDQWRALYPTVKPTIDAWAGISVTDPFDIAVPTTSPA